MFRKPRPSAHGERRAPILACALALGFVSGCAGTPTVTHVELPKELPTELKDKFEVKDASTLPQAAASPTPVPETAAPGQKSTKPKKNRARKKSHKKEAPPVAAAFVFPSRRPVKDPIWTGEKEVYEISYFGMSAGDFTLESLPYQAVNHRKVYHIKGTAVSSPVFSLFYRLNDTVETFIDYDGLFSQRFHLILDESKQSRDALELNDSEKSQTFYWNKWYHVERGYTETKEYAPVPQFSQDSLSALYYLRAVPLKDGDVFSFPVISEGKWFEAVITVIRHEPMDTVMGHVQTVVVKPDTRFQGVLQKRGDSYIWLTDDDRRVPVRIEAKVKIGTVTARLKKYEPGSP